MATHQSRASGAASSQFGNVRRLRRRLPDLHRRPRPGLGRARERTPRRHRRAFIATHCTGRRRTLRPGSPLRGVRRRRGAVGSRRPRPSRDGSRPGDGVVPRRQALVQVALGLGRERLQLLASQLRRLLRRARGSRSCATIDDNDGNLANGTPHAAAIFAAFDRHKIACGLASDASNQNTTTCPVLTRPDAVDDGRLRLSALTWTTVPGALWLQDPAQRLRLSGGDRRASPGIVTTGSFTDLGLANGSSIYYNVQAFVSNSRVRRPAVELPGGDAAAGRRHRRAGRRRLRLLVADHDHRRRLQHRKQHDDRSTWHRRPSLRPRPSR